ncbi:amidase [Phytoactinopolyspora halotolerans]|uniref:Amidase n=1 Tax=Phytoactinopolyspora halotolerans TaxID=1981512 RepID=A0A6L9S7K5_9ACTN|nr:amidase [Phytoactinopolyspora halotolerans]NED99949.1 amidase [Phytoactinopolyspora halotolerans]
MVIDATWLLRLETDGDGPRLAVKDCIDVAGTPTTAACPALMDDPAPAAADAPVVETARRQGARIVGKTNLVELCRHIDGINPWTGTPTNPIDPERVPGGSSSGSAVAVANDEADVGYGTDTGGSVRVPAACCGITGLKTTAGRVPTHGVVEFSRTLDTVGPLARDVAGLAVGMELMEPGFRQADASGVPLTAARLRFADVDPGIDTSLDAVLAAAGVKTVDVTLPEWESWVAAANDIMGAEGYWAQRHLLDRPDLLEERDVESIGGGARIKAGRVAECRRIGLAARSRLGELLADHAFLALPTLRAEPPRMDDVRPGMTYLTVPLNLAGLPAVALPVPRTDGGFPASLQLVGAWYAEEELLAAAAVLEAAVAAR